MKKKISIDLQKYQVYNHIVDNILVAVPVEKLQEINDLLEEYKTLRNVPNNHLVRVCMIPLNKQNDTYELAESLQFNMRVNELGYNFIELPHIIDEDDYVIIEDQ